MNTYARETLKFGENMTYKPSAHEPGFNWDMKHHAYGPEGWEGTSTNVMGDIAYTMKVEPEHACAADGRLLRPGHAVLRRRV